MPTDFQKLFQELGLSPTETKIYLASFALGPTSVQEIAKKARLSRTAAYDAIASLQQRGLLSNFERGKKKFFSAEDPERAISYFRERIRRSRTRLEEFENAVTELKLLGGGEKPTVRFFEGREAVYALYTDFSKVNPKQLDEVSNLDDVYDRLEVDYLKDIRKVVDPSKVQVRVLHHGKLRNQPREQVEFCELLPELGEFHGDIWIYGNRVAFVEFLGKTISVIIESEAFANTARILFESAWRICRK